MQAVSAIFGLRGRAAAILIACVGLLLSACEDRIPFQDDAPVISVPAVETRFLESADTAALVYVQHRARTPGDCLFDNLSRSTVAERRGSLCDAERMTGGAAAADVNGDGAIDILVTRLDGHDLLFRNRGDGRFEDVSNAVGLSRWNLATNGVVWGDIDNDGDLDLFTDDRRRHASLSVCQQRRRVL